MASTRQRSNRSMSRLRRRAPSRSQSTAPRTSSRRICWSSRVRRPCRRAVPHAGPNCLRIGRPSGRALTARRGVHTERDRALVRHRSNPHRRVRAHVLRAQGGRRRREGREGRQAGRAGARPPPPPHRRVGEFRRILLRRSRRSSRRTSVWCSRSTLGSRRSTRRSLRLCVTSSPRMACSTRSTHLWPRPPRPRRSLAACLPPSACSSRSPHPTITATANIILQSQVDESGASIGRRYTRADELGIPYALTVDFDTLGTGEKVRGPDLRSRGILSSAAAMPPTRIARGWTVTAMACIADRCVARQHRNAARARLDRAGATRESHECPAVDGPP